MKRILLASVAAFTTAGMASAQGIMLSGSAELGIIGGVAHGDVVQFHTDIDVTFTLSGATDNGLTFGATIDLDEEGGFAGTNGGPESVFLSGNFGTITMGDTDGAFDWALQEVGRLGSIDDSHTSHLGYNGNSGLDGYYDGQIVRYNYAFSSFAFAISAEIDDTGTGDPVFGFGGTYSGQLASLDLSVGLGYQTVDAGATHITVTGISAGIADENWSVGLSYSFERFGTAFDVRHYGIGGTFDVDDRLSVHANYGLFDSSVGPDTSGFGLAVNYDLGGGAQVQFGYGDSRISAGGGGPTYTEDSFSLGVAMSF